MEFTLTIRLGKEGAEDYSALNSALLTVHDAIHKLYRDRVKHGMHVPPFKQTAQDVFTFEINKPPRAFGKWKIAPAEDKLSARMAASFPWLEAQVDTSITGFGTIEELQDFYDLIVTEGR